MSSRGTGLRNLPAIQQRSIEELIERNLVLHQRSMNEIWIRFRNTVIVKALDLSKGNASKASQMLKVHRNTFGKWMKEIGIQEKT